MRALKFHKNIILAIMLLPIISCKAEKEYPAPTFPEPIKHRIFVNPPDGWVGDVMPYYLNGKFEIFFLHDAPNSVKNNSSGQHPIHKYTSTDLSSFNYEGEVIKYGSILTQDHLLGTGAYIKVGGTHYFYYTGFNSSPSWLNNVNPGFAPSNNKEAVLLATSTDFKTWTKKSSFIMRPQEGFLQADFRDPYVFYSEETMEYWMLVSAQKNGRGYLLKYTSSNPANDDWAYRGTLDVEGDYLMLECADIFKIGDKYYLLFAEDWSNDKGTHYRVSNSINGPWVLPPNGMDKLDGHQFYAAKTASDGTNRYAFGWAHRRTPENNDGNRNWGGNLIFHKVEADAQGNLVLKYAPVIDQIIPSVTALQLSKKSQQVSVTGNQFTLDGSSEPAELEFDNLSELFKVDFKLTFEAGKGDFNIILKNKNSNKKYIIGINAENDRITSYNDGNFISSAAVALQNNVSNDVRIVIDGTICVVYINNKLAFTNRIYDITESTLMMQASAASVKLTDLAHKN